VRVVWTTRARERLHRVHAYIATDAPAVADDVVRRLVRRSRQLEAAPRSGRSVPEYDRDDIRELSERPYRIVYRILTDRIDILTVMHYHQLLPGDLQGLGNGKPSR